MGTFYETRSVRSEDCGTGVEIERYTSLADAVVGSLELWPEDEWSDVLIFLNTNDKTDLLATIRHHHHDDLAIATVSVFATTDDPYPIVNEYRCEYVEIFGRIHTNIMRVSD